MDNVLTAWALRWGISGDALNDLYSRLSAEVIPEQPTVDGGPTSESHVQTHIRFDAARSGITAWRNNVGAGKLENGSFIRWGLCNDSSKLNERYKSADLVGIKPIYITTGHVGQTIGQFWARECKESGWRCNLSDPRTRAQYNWLMLVNTLGGDAGFTTGV